MPPHHPCPRFMRATFCDTRSATLSTRQPNGGECTEKASRDRALPVLLDAAPDLGCPDLARASFFHITRSTGSETHFAIRRADAGKRSIDADVAPRTPRLLRLLGFRTLHLISGSFGSGRHSGLIPQGHCEAMKFS